MFDYSKYFNQPICLLGCTRLSGQFFKSKQSIALDRALGCLILELSIQITRVAGIRELPFTQTRNFPDIRNYLYEKGPILVQKRKERGFLSIGGRF